MDTFFSEDEAMEMVLSVVSSVRDQRFTMVEYIIRL